MAGTVRSAPPDSGFAVGDRVAGLCSTAAWRRWPANDLTVHFVLRTRARMAPGETVLGHGAAGGIGVSALRLAPALGAARTIAVVSDEAKAAIAREAGATDVVLVDCWAKQVAALTDAASM